MRDYPFIYSQRDPAWAAQRLGTVDGATIGAYGCILTCQAMKAGYYGHEIKPNALDDIFTNRKLYVQGDLLPDIGIHQVFDDVQLIEEKSFAGIPTDMNYLKDKAQDPTLTVTIEVDFDHDPHDGIQTHFVELHSYDGIHLRIYDPWYGQEDDFSTHYGTDPVTTIQKFALYKGNVRAPAMLVDTDLYTKLVTNSTANDAVCDELGLPHDAGKDAEVASITKLKVEKTQTQTTLDNLNKQIPVLEQQFKTSQNEVLDLQQQLKVAQAAAVHPDSGLDYMDLYNQAERDLIDMRNNLAASEETNKRQMAQYQNTSSLLMPVGQVLWIAVARLLHLPLTITKGNGTGTKS